MADDSVADDDFYRQLTSFSDFGAVVDDERYVSVPESWLLVISDVRGSTKAIEAGRYKEVNSAGVASIVAVRNAMPDVDLPYVFGGDGATLLVPASRRDALERALRGLRISCREAFDLDMRVGVIPLAELRAEGAPIEVARFQSSPDVCFAMLRGRGLDLGEKWLKDDHLGPRYWVPEEGESDVSFEGFQCRWQAVPARNGVAVSLIVKALAEDPGERQEAYRLVLQEVSALSQAIDEGRPLSMKTLKLRSRDDAFDQEVRLKSSVEGGPAPEKLRTEISKEVRYAKILFAARLKMGGFNGRRYRQEVLANTDFRKFDNVLRMHMDLRKGQLERLKEVLQAAEDEGYLIYGIHTAAQTLMTCVIDSYQGSHAHFVDGAAGGYALAARRIKAILAGHSSEA